MIGFEQSFPVAVGLQSHTPWLQTPLFEQELGQKANEKCRISNDYFFKKKLKKIQLMSVKVAISPLYWKFAFVWNWINKEDPDDWIGEGVLFFFWKIKN